MCVCVCVVCVCVCVGGGGGGGVRQGATGRQAGRRRSSNCSVRGSRRPTQMPPCTLHPHLQVPGQHRHAARRRPRRHCGWVFGRQEGGIQLVVAACRAASAGQQTDGGVSTGRVFCQARSAPHTASGPLPCCPHRPAPATLPPAAASHATHPAGWPWAAGWWSRRGCPPGSPPPSAAARTWTSRSGRR